MSDQEDRAKEKKIPLVECFGPTIQGEGSVIGQQTYFLRFGLCDYKCTMCDSMHAVDPMQVRASAQWLTQEGIASVLESLAGKFPNSTRNVTFSGGNPCIHDLTELVRLLQIRSWKVQVETQGTFCPDWLLQCDDITISPKGPGMGEKTDFEVLDEFVWKVTDDHHSSATMKIVIFDQRDIEFAKQVHERYHDLGNLSWYLSLGNPDPVGSQRKFKMPDMQDEQRIDMMDAAIDRYKLLFEDIRDDMILSQFRFLPQWHWFLWGSEKGR